MSEGKREAPSEATSGYLNRRLRTVQEALDDIARRAAEAPKRERPVYPDSVQPRPGGPILATVDGVATEDFRRVMVLGGVPVSLVKGFE